jgi:hypothetical protein
LLECGLYPVAAAIVLRISPALRLRARKKKGRALRLRF